jgi:hypothetical protein
MKIRRRLAHMIVLRERWISNGTGGIDPVIEPDPANVQEPLIGAFKPVEQLSLFLSDCIPAVRS